jgi:8-oxo-dGTP diphosphatase
VGSPWFARVTSKEASPRAVDPIKKLIAEYDGPIDEVLDILDPPGTLPKSSRSYRSISLKDASDDQIIDASIDSIDGLSMRLQPNNSEDSINIRSARSSRSFSEADFYGSDPDEVPVFDEPEQFDGMWTPDEEQLRDLEKRSTPPVIGDKYKILQDDNGVFYADGISSRDVMWLRSGKIQPPKLPFFAPLGGGNNMDTGEGYYFSVNGKRYWGRYGAAGALVRRRNKDGEYEYFLGRRAKGMSSGGGKWSFPGGAHKDRESANTPGATAVEEFGEEVGGDISSLKPLTVFNDQVAPDWSYDTYLFEDNNNVLGDLRPETGETSDVGWFTADEIRQLDDDGDLLESFSKAFDKILKQSGSSRSTRSNQDAQLREAKRPNVSKAENRMTRGDGMIERDERGRPTSWNSEKFLREQSEKRVALLKNLGFSDDEIQSLLGVDPSTSAGSSRSSRVATMRIELQDLFRKQVRPNPNSAPFSGIRKWSDDEIINALDVHSVRMPRKHEENGIGIVPDWFPTVDQLTSELERRGYQVFLMPGTSRRYQDQVYVASPDVNADDILTDRRIIQPSGLLQQLVEVNKSTNNSPLFSSSLKDWDFISYLSKMSDDELMSLSLDFDKQRAEKIAMRQNGTLSNAEFDEWYNGLTRLRRMASDEMTKRSVRRMAQDRQKLTPANDVTLSISDYVFLKKATPSLRSKRSFGLVVDSLIDDGLVNETTFNEIEKYHDIKDYQLGQLGEAFSAALSIDPFEPSLKMETLDPNQRKIAKDIIDKFDYELSKNLSSLDLGSFSAMELDAMGIDQDDIEDIIDRPLRMSSRSSRKKKAKKDKPALRPNKKLTPEELRISQEQKLRAQTIPKKRRPGPSIGDWKESKAFGHTSRSAIDAKNIATLNDVAIGRNPRFIGQLTDIDGSSRFTSFASDIKPGDILPNGIFNSSQMQSKPKYQVLSANSLNSNSRFMMVRDLGSGHLLGIGLHDQQPLSDVIRPSGNRLSSRSSRIGIPTVRNKVFKSFENDDDEAIIEYVQSLLDQHRDIRDQIDLIDRQAGDIDIPDVDEKRWTQLEEISFGIEREINEILASISFLGSESNNHDLSVSSIDKALKDISRSGSFLIERNGLEPSDLDSIVEILKQQKQELSKSYLGKKNERIDKLASSIDQRIMDASGFSEFVEFEPIDFEDDDIVRQRDKLASDLIQFAISSVMREREIDNASGTIINTTAREIEPSSILALPSSNGSSRSVRKPNQPVMVMGKDLPLSRRIFPSSNSKFSNGEFKSIIFDGNKGELIVVRKNGETTRFGGIDDEILSTFLDKKKSVTASFNELDKLSRYLVRPNGDMRGQANDIPSLLTRDLNRIDLSNAEKQIVSNLIDSFTKDNVEKLDDIKPEQLHGLVNKLYENNETAFANNILEATESARSMRTTREPVAQVFRYGQPKPDKDINLILRADEVAELREELQSLQQKFGFNPIAKNGLAIYSQILKTSQSDNPIHKISVSPAEFDAINTSFTHLLRMPQARESDYLSLQPLEIAASSPKYTYDSTVLGGRGISRKLGPLNNSAPLNFSSDDIENIKQWSSENANNGLISRISSDIPTLNWWRSMDALRRFWPSKQSREQRSLPDENLGFSGGTPLSALIDDSYKNLSPVDKLIWLKQNIASSENKKGIKPTDVSREAKSITDFLEIAGRNFSRRDEFNKFTSSEGVTPEDMLPVRNKNWVSLSKSGKEYLDAESRKLYSQDFLDLNPAQSTNVLRRLRSGSSGRSHSISSIDDADINAILSDHINAFNKFIPTFRAQRNNNVEGIDTSLPKPLKTNFPQTASSPRMPKRGINMASAIRPRTVAQPVDRPATKPPMPKSNSESQLRRINESRQFARMLNTIAENLEVAYSSRYNDSRLSDTFRAIQNIFIQPNDTDANKPNIFTLGDLDSATDIADNMLASPLVADISNGKWSSMQKMPSSSAQNSLFESVGRLRAIRKELSSMRDRYEDDPFIGRERTKIVNIPKSTPQNMPVARRPLENVEPIDAVEKYLSSARLVASSRSSRSIGSGKDGRAEIRTEATKFKELLDSLDVEIRKSDDREISAALTKLKAIITRQKAGLISDKRTNAGALFLTQNELDEIIEALYMAMDRQIERGSEMRSRLFGEFAELMAKAAMATFIDKTVEPVHSRTVKKINEAGREVEVLLYE